MRTFKTEEIILDDFTPDEATKLSGVLTIRNEFDKENDLLYIEIGGKQIGWITRREMLEAAKKMLQLWPLKSSVGEK